jgi:hypothetical protein
MINPKDMKIFDMSYKNHSIDDVSNDTEFIALLHVSGVKFSSRTFQIYTELKQVMIMNKDDIFSSCLIKSPVEEAQQPSKEDNLVVGDGFEEQIILEHSGQEEETPETKQTIEAVMEEVIEKAIMPQMSDDEMIEIPVATQEEVVVSNEVVHAQDPQQTSGDMDMQEIEHEEKPDNVEDIDKNDGNNEKNTEMQEFDVNFQTLENSDIHLQEPELEHIEKYKNAVKKAKELRKEALQTHLEAQNIKAKYLLNVYSDSDSDESLELGEE